MNIQEAIEKVLTGNCILFTGAGFSRSASNINGLSPKTGKQLAKHLYEQCDIDEDNDNLAVASDMFLDTHGETSLINLLKEEYTIKSISEDHELIGRLPWKRTYTTNYDHILELAFHSAGKLLTPVTLNDKTNEYKDKRKLAIHLNGFIDRLTPSTLKQEFKLTNTSYLTTEFNQSNWLDLFRSDLKTADAIIFIGFSCSSDLDLSRIIAQQDNGLKDKCFFIVAPNESVVSFKTLEKFGQPQKIGLDGFAALVKEIEKGFVPPETSTYFFKSFQKIEIAEIPSNPLRDIDFLNLLLYGDANTDLLHQSLVDAAKFQYYLQREELTKAIERIDSGITNILAHSNLGNGKTLFVLGLADLLKTRGVDVYVFKKYFDLTNDEIEKICYSTNKHAIIIENYSAHLDLIETIEKFRTKNTVLIITERSLVNDTVYSTFEDIIEQQYISYDLNRLHRPEVKNLVDMFSHYGLWGKNAAGGLDRKMREVVDTFQSSIRLVLLDLINSPDIRDRLSKLITPLKANPPFYNAALLILASSIFGFEIDLDDLIFLLDDELLANPSFYNNSQLKEIIDFNARKIRVKSSILAEAVFQTNHYGDDLLKVLIKVVRRLDNHRFNKNNYYIMRSIISHSRLQRLFNTKDNRDFNRLIISFFEEVKNLGYSRDNPFFWLQYAIARLAVRDYPIADKYFKTAYSYAAKGNKGIDTFQIDNHYARHILENEIYNGDTHSCMEQFLKAHKILTNRTDQNNNRHYPIKVARHYSGFYERYFDSLNNQDQKVFLVSCQEILNRIDDYNAVMPEATRNRVVKDCFNDLSRILLSEKAKLN